MFRSCRACGKINYELAANRQSYTYANSQLNLFPLEDAKPELHLLIEKLPGIIP
jgi:hypothetical protein